MDIHLLSFSLAVLVGVVCFGLVRHTANEFDRWYEEKADSLNLKLSTAAGSLAGVIALILIFKLF